MRVVDRIAYINHDIDDAIRAGVIGFGDLPADEIAILGDTGLRADRDARRRPDRPVRWRAGAIAQGDEVGGAMLRLREFMFERVYLGPSAQREAAGSSGCCAPCSPGTPRTRRRPRHRTRANCERVVDYLAGMTDRFAVRAFSELSVPQGF